MKTSPGKSFPGIVLAAEGSHVTALEYFQVAEELWPENPDIKVEMGNH